MRKVELVARIAARTDLTRTQAEEAVEAILATIKEGLQQGEPVSLRGLGTFHVRAKRARMARNPRTGAAAGVPARWVVAFKVGQLFKQAVAGVAIPAADPAPSRPQAPPGRTGALQHTASPAGRAGERDEPGQTSQEKERRRAP